MNQDKVQDPSQPPPHDPAPDPAHAPAPAAPLLETAVFRVPFGPDAIFNRFGDFAFLQASISRPAGIIHASPSFDWHLISNSNIPRSLSRRLVGDEPDRAIRSFFFQQAAKLHYSQRTSDSHDPSLELDKLRNELAHLKDAASSIADENASLRQERDAALQLAESRRNRILSLEAETFSMRCERDGFLDRFEQILRFADIDAPSPTASSRS